MDSDPNKKGNSKGTTTFKSRLTTPKNPHLLMTVFMGNVIAIISLLIYSALNRQTTFESTLNHFTTLHEVFKKDGIDEFLSAKKGLKRGIARALRKKTTSHAYISAQNVAVFLFPELLSNDNFEKDVALTAWTPIQKKIENAPETHASRLAFEEMRAYIWNYESPDRSSPTISPHARQVIRIYDALSSQ